MAWLAGRDETNWPPVDPGPENETSPPTLVARSTSREPRGRPWPLIGSPRREASSGRLNSTRSARAAASKLDGHEDLSSGLPKVD